MFQTQGGTGSTCDMIIHDWRMHASSAVFLQDSWAAVNDEVLSCLQLTLHTFWVSPPLQTFLISPHTYNTYLTNPKNKQSSFKPPGFTSTSLMESVFWELFCVWNVITPNWTTKAFSLENGKTLALNECLLPESQRLILDFFLIALLGHAGPPRHTHVFLARRLTLCSEHNQEHDERHLEVLGRQDSSYLVLACTCGFA